MNEQEYIQRLEAIRKDINALVDELWAVPENKEAFSKKNFLYKQVIEDVTTGYESEE